VGKWPEDEDSKLKDGVHTHGDKDWVAIATLVPVRRQKQCRNRWRVVLDRRSGIWTEAGDLKLKNSLQIKGSPRSRREGGDRMPLSTSPLVLERQNELNHNQARHRAVD
jgi:hypothetical protein